MSETDFGEILLIGYTSLAQFYLPPFGSLGKIYICYIPSLEYEFACHKDIEEFCITHSVAEHMLAIFIDVIVFYKPVFCAATLY